jgi:hypothetical protein
METVDENTRKWIRRLQGINRCLGEVADVHKHSDIEMIAEIFLKLPQIYSEFVTSSNLRGAAGSKTLPKVIKDLERYYKRKVLKGGSVKHIEKERLAFVAVGEDRKAKKSDFAKAFKGLCNKCGKQGHKGSEYRVRPENYVKGQKGFEKNYFKTNNGHNKKYGTQNSDRTKLR